MNSTMSSALSSPYPSLSRYAASHSSTFIGETATTLLIVQSSIPEWCQPRSVTRGILPTQRLNRRVGEEFEVANVVPAEPGDDVHGYVVVPVVRTA